jgi:EAL domain-containing protein (putative c-di-GMP-specific phosphodiesterase class I)
MVGCEALLRWNHPWEGQLTAESFIAIAESSGLVNSLTETLLLEACKTVVDLASSTGGAKSVAVNLSPRQLADPRLVSLAEIALSRLAAEPSSLTIEITETAVLSDLDATLNTLRKLRELGVEIALDDFGTGYSSLTHLKKLPVTKLKIDRSFVGGITRDSEDLSIVASVAHLARTLGLTCVAEGVETNEQSYILEDLGCEQAQGYLWSPAVPFADLIRLTGKRGFPRPGRLSDWSVDEDTRARILGLHRAGTSLEAIAGLLNQSGSRTARGARWKTSGVARVIARWAFSRLEPDAGD